MKNIQLFSRVSFLDKLMFTKHMAIMIKAGVPITEAIETLSAHSKSHALQTTLEGIQKDIENGDPMYKSMSKYPKVFDTLYLNLIKVSEKSGTLEENLVFLSSQLEKDYSLRKKIQSAMFYPAIILTAGVVIGGFISLFILPKLVDFFEALEIDLPMTTKILLFFANLMKDHGILIFSIAGAAFIIIRILLQVSFIKPKWHKVKLKIPLFGKLMKYGQLARFSRNFGVMLKSGVSVTTSLKTTAETMENLVYQSQLLEIEKMLNRGKNVSDALVEKKYKEFPPIIEKMIRVGEKTGNLEEVLLYLGDFYEDEIDNITKNLTTVLEPILLLVIGLLVGFVALAIISPIYKITGSIRR